LGVLLVTRIGVGWWGIGGSSGDVVEGMGIEFGERLGLGHYLLAKISTGSRRDHG